MFGYEVNKDLKWNSETNWLLKKEEEEEIPTPLVVPNTLIGAE